jgi:hypothetical protein
MHSTMQTLQLQALPPKIGRSIYYIMEVEASDRQTVSRMAVVSGLSVREVPYVSQQTL